MAAMELAVIGAAAGIEVAHIEVVVHMELAEAEHIEGVHIGAAACIWYPAGPPGSRHLQSRRGPAVQLPW